MRSASPASLSIATCCACLTASALRKAMTPCRSRSSSARGYRRRCGRSLPTCRSCTDGASASRSRSATSARCATTAIITSTSSPKSVATDPQNVTRKRFEQLVAEAIDQIPAHFRREMKNIAVVVEDEPDDALLDEMEIEPPDSLYGLYQGTPLPERTSGYGNTLPDRVTLFKKIIEEDCETEDDVRDVIGETLIHEVGHYFGLSEEEIEAIEERYWRGEAED